jgi:proteasome lid subunit RPN8/RPN11
MDPTEVLAALNEMGASGWSLGAIVHSHVLSAPTPSATDLREAYYPDALMLIISFADAEAVAKLWRTQPGASGSEVREARLIVISG